MQIFISGKVYNTATQTIKQIENHVNNYINRVGYYDPATFKLEIISDNEILLTYNREISRLYHVDTLSYRDANLVCGISDTFELPQMWGIFGLCDSAYMQTSFFAKSYKYNSRILCPENRITDVGVSVAMDIISIRITY
ncbi:MAG: hypothetical protein SNF93_06915 [Rikenellaceae bacterium]